METCKGINCTSDGMTPHSAECAAEYERVTAECEFDVSRVFVSVDELNALTADANRYRGLRLIVCEPNEDVQERMFEAVDEVMTGLPDIKNAPTPEMVDGLFDTMIAAAAGARNAGG
jgi:hypothetical protein